MAKRFRLDASFDGTVFAYAFAAVVFTGLFVGVWPALRATRADVNTILHEGGRGDSGGGGSHRTQQAMMAAQVAGSLTLLIVSVFFVQSLRQAGHMNLGFDPDHVLNVMMDPRELGYNQTRTRTFYRELEDRVRSMPGVQSASLALTVPLTYNSALGPGHYALGALLLKVGLESGVTLICLAMAPDCYYNSNNMLEVASWSN